MVSQETIDWLSNDSRRRQNEHRYPRAGKVPAVIFFSAMNKLVEGKTIPIKVGVVEPKDSPLEMYSDIQTTRVYGNESDLVYYRAVSGLIECAFSSEALELLGDHVILSILDDRRPRDDY